MGGESSELRAQEILSRKHLTLPAAELQVTHNINSLDARDDFCCCCYLYIYIDR